MIAFRQLMRFGLLAVPTLLFVTRETFAHASDRGHVLLLPTGHYLVGGALAVLASFVVLVFLPASRLHQILRKGRLLWSAFSNGRAVASTASFCLLVLLLCAGWYGSRDPLTNPLPLTFWGLIWVGLVILQGFVGNIWSWINPWYGPWHIVRHFAGGDFNARLSWPRALSTWPAVLGLAAFAWFELVYPAPDDPSRLATAIASYWLITFLAMVLFGYERWSRRGEFLSVFLAIIARLSLVRVRGHKLVVHLPAARLINAPRLPASGVVFLLLALSSVTFDGLRHTFVWMQMIGANPLEFPGRSAVITETTVGLAIAFALLTIAFIGTVTLGHIASGTVRPLKQAVSPLVWTIVPISFAYHVAHYLPSLLIDGQYALVALSDPFARGADLLGMSGYHVQAALLSSSGSAWMLWNVQALTIVAGHILAVVAAHIAAWRIYGDGRAAIITQLPLVALMIGYTVIGLWLLSTPTAM